MDFFNNFIVEINNYDKEKVFELIEDVRDVKKISEIRLSSEFTDPFDLDIKILKEIIIKIFSLKNFNKFIIESSLIIKSPEKIDKNTIKVLKLFSPFYIKIDINNFNSFTEKSFLICEKLINQGIEILADISINIEKEHDLNLCKKFFIDILNTHITIENMNLNCNQSILDEINNFLQTLQ